MRSTPLLVLAILPVTRPLPQADAQVNPTMIERPLTARMLASGDFVAFTLYWQVVVSGGDSIVFHLDGTVTNRRAALGGSWEITSDSSVIIRTTDPLGRAASHRPFVLRNGELVTPADSGRASLFTIRRRSPIPPPPWVLGRFMDDYGNRYQITDTAWVQLPDARHRVVRWKSDDQYAVMQNDGANRYAPGKWTRIDWMAFEGMAPYTWGFCMTAYEAATREAAEATTPANRAAPRTGCNGYPFSRMKPDTIP